VIAGGSPMTDAVAFAQWKTAERLVAQGARTTFAEAAAWAWATGSRPR